MQRLTLTKSLQFVTMFCVAFLVVVLSSRPAISQVDYTQQIGAPVFSSLEPVELGYVNAANGNLHLEIPIASFPQRGMKQPLTYKLVYDSRIWWWNVSSAEPNTYQNPYPTTPWTGWRFITSADHGTVGETTWTNFCVNGGHQVADQGENQFWWQAPDGTRHYFNGSLQFSANCGGQVELCTAGSALDASGYWMIYNGNASCQGSWPLGQIIVAPDGTRVYLPSGGGLKDSNGNYYSSDSSNNVIDTLGRTPVSVTSNGTNGCPINKVCYDVLNSQGGSTRSRWIVTTESIPVHTGFGTGDYSGNITVIQSITLPDGTAYSFTYDSGSTYGHFGEVTGITLPTGGNISYSYTVYTDSLPITQHWVHMHTSGGGQTTYALGNVNSTNHTQSVTVTKPSNDYKVYSFATTNVTTYPPCSGSWKNQAQSYSASGTLLSTINYTWDTLTACGRQTTEVVTLPTTNGGSISKQTKFVYSNTYSADPVTVKEWNYYSGSPSSTPDRITNATYLNDTNSAYAPGTGQNILNLPTKVQVTDGNGNALKETDYGYDTTAIGSMPNVSNHDDANYGTGFTARGNQTLVKQWTSGSNYLTAATMTYDQTGQETSSTDANNHQTTYSHADCYRIGNPPTTYTPSPATNAFLTQTNLPASGNTQSCYYWNTGKTAWTKDQNSATTSYFYVTYGSGSNDPLDRLITTTLPTGGWSVNVFSIPPTTEDTYTGITTASPTTSCTAAGSCRHDKIQLDGLARTTDQILVNDPDGQTTVHTDYDSSGRVQDTSHPYRTSGDATYGFETPSYDGLDRKTQMLHPDNTATKSYYGASVAAAGGLGTQQCNGTCHLGYPTLGVDESGKMRQTWTDAFGKVVEVDEPASSANVGTWGAVTWTAYSYDLLGNLTGVLVPTGANGECNRSYTYDALSRMLSSTEPEVSNATTCGNHVSTTYSYSVPGTICSGDVSSICSKTDPRGIVKTYLYSDAMNRLTQVSYSDSTPAVNYYYDQTSYNGLAITNGAGLKTGMSDGSGQVAWSYDANGNVITERRTITAVLPAVTKTISYSYNLDDSLAALTYPSGRIVNYQPTNAQRQGSAVDTNGTQYALAPSSGWMYWPTGALDSAVYGKGGTFAGITETRGYNNRLELTSISASSSAGNALNLAPLYNANGEIYKINNNLEGGRTANYSYDSLSRITAGSSQATSGGDCWGQSFTTDNVGNLTKMTVSQCSANSLTVTANQNNQFGGYSYDQIGDLQNDGLYSYSYNGEQEVTSANGVTYVYDGERDRVMKSSGTLYWRDTDGNTITETNLSGATTNDYVFFGGRRVARIDSGGNVFYYEADQIGSTRAIVNSSGTLCYDADFTPYGYEIAHTNTCPQSYKFAGYERDSETGLDYAINRYFSSRLGRFMNPDPIGLGAATLADPQTLMQYGYARNNPLSLTDPGGLRWICKPGEQTTDPNGTMHVEVDCHWEPDPPPSDDLCSNGGSLAYFTFCTPDARKTWTASANTVDLAAKIEYNAIGFFFPVTSLVVDQIIGSDSSNKTAAAAGINRKPGKLGQFKGTDALRRENKMSRDIMKDLKLSADKRQIVHEALQEGAKDAGRPLTYEEGIEAVKAVLGLL